ncbi:MULTISPECIES: hypothetical protein [unclassified Microcoleus]
MSSSDITHSQDTALPCPYKSGNGYIGLGDGGRAFAGATMF